MVANNTIAAGQQKRGRTIPAMLTMSRHDMKRAAARRWQTTVYSAIGSACQSVRFQVVGTQPRQMPTTD